MKTIQAFARYFPDNCGGIQIHTTELMPVLKTLGVESKVVAAQDESKDNIYNYKGIEVYRYPVFPTPNREPNHGEVPHGGFEYFARWLKEQKSDIYHQHQLTPKSGLAHLRLAKELGMATVVSIRLPHPICQRETLMFNGEKACDGRIDVVRCSQCCGVTQKLPPSVLKSLSRMPMPVSVMAGDTLRSANPASAKAALLRSFSIPAFVAARQFGLQEMAKYADRIVAMSQWVYEALASNDIPREKLYLLRHGISDNFVDAAQQRMSQPKKHTGILRVGFLGRWDRTKGIHVLVEAVKLLPPDVNIELVIHGVGQDEAYRKQLMERIADDPRIVVAKQLKREELPEALSGFDVLAVPSQWLETGPMVVLEAHTYNLPVVGSNLGGVAEKVKHGVDGLLVPPSDAKAWAEAFTRLAKDANFLASLREGIKPVRTISMEAADTVELYRTILAEQSAKKTYGVSANLQLQPL